MYGNVRANRLVIKVTNRPWVVFSNVQRASNQGLFHSLRNGSTVALSSNSLLTTLARAPGAQAQLLFSLTRRHPIANKAPGVWLLRTGYRSQVGPTVDLNHLVSSRSGFQTDQTWEYQEFVSSAASRHFSDHFFANTRGISAKFVKYSNHRALFYVRHLCGPVDLDDALKPERPTYVWSTGFYPFVRPTPIWIPQAGTLAYEDRFLKDPPWRYARGVASLVFHPDRCGAEMVKVSMTLYSALPGFVDLSGPISYKQIPVNAAGSQITFHLHLSGRRSATLKFNASTPLQFTDEAIPRSDGPPLNHIHLFVSINSLRVISAGGEAH